MGYFAQWMMLFGSFILLWIIGFSVYFYEEQKAKKSGENKV